MGWRCAELSLEGEYERREKEWDGDTCLGSLGVSYETWILMVPFGDCLLIYLFLLTTTEYLYIE